MKSRLDQASRLQIAAWGALSALSAAAAPAAAGPHSAPGAGAAPPGASQHIHPSFPSGNLLPHSVGSTRAPVLRVAEAKSFGFLHNSGFVHPMMPRKDDAVAVAPPAPRTTSAVRATPRLLASDTEVVLDNTLVTADLQPVNGVYAITPNFGKQVGGNLFYSFSSFSLTQGQTANFMPGSTPPQTTVQNVLVRVTGNNPSKIDGQIACTIPDAALFFMNPAGVTFTTNASLNLQGSFYLTTANYIRFADTTTFAATNPAGPALLSPGDPIAFGFRGNSPAGVTVNGQPSQNQTLQPTLNSPSNGSLYVVAGNIAINGGELASTDSPATIVSAGSAGEVMLASGQSVGVIASGNILLTNGGMLGSNTDMGIAGNVIVTARNVTVDGLPSFLGSNNAGSGASGSFQLTAAGAVTVTNGGVLGSSSTAQSVAATSGNITVRAGNVTVDGNGSFLGYKGGGTAGSVQVAATGAVAVTNGGYISAASSNFTSGGNLTVTAGDIMVDGQGSFLGTNIDRASLQVNVAGDVAVTNGGFLGAQGVYFAGAVSLKAANLKVSGQASEVGDYAFLGIAQGLVISANRISLSGGARIRLESDGGSGVNGPLEVTTSVLTLDGRTNPAANWTSLYTFSTSAATGGNLTIKAGELDEFGAAAFGAGSSGTGAPGTTNLQIGRLMADAQASAPHVVLTTSLGNSVLTGPNYVIPSIAGTLIGGNYFLRFSSLTLAPFESLMIAEPNGATAVFAGVSANPSVLDGTLAVKSPVNFYLVSPKGIDFGPDAILNIPGAVTLTTADYLVLGSWGRFGVSDSASSTLVPDAPSAFGFLPGRPPTAIVVNGNMNNGTSVNDQVQSIIATPNTPLFVVGGDIVVNGGGLSAIGGGAATFVSIGSPGQAIVTGGSVDTELFSKLGNVSVGGGGFLGSSIGAATTAPVDGPVVLDAASVTVSGVGSAISCAPSGTPSTITLTVTGHIAVTNGGSIGTGPDYGISFFGATSGSVIITAGSVSVDGGRGLLTPSALGTFGGAGPAAPLRLTVSGALSVSGGAFVGSDARGIGGTDAGPVEINAASISVDGVGSELASRSGFGISSSLQVNVSHGVSVTNSGILGSDATRGTNSGAVSVNAASVFVGSGGTIQSAASQTGIAGAVAIHASQILLDGQGVASQTGIAIYGPLSPNPPASGFDLSISASQSLEVRNGASVAADTFGTSRAGAIQIQGPMVTLDGGGSISARSFAGGPGGSIEVDAITLSLSGGSFISADNYQGSLAGGQVVIATKNLTLDGGSSISASGGGGLAGDLTATLNFTNPSYAASNVYLISPQGTRVLLDITPQDSTYNPTTYEDGAASFGATNYITGVQPPIGLLSSFTAKDLDGTWKLVLPSVTDGPVTLNGWSLSFAGSQIGQSTDVPKSGASISSSLMVANVNPGLTGGSSGDIIVKTKTLSVLNGSTISATTLGTGSAGNVNVTADNILVSGTGSSIQSQTAAPPNGQLTTRAGNAGNVSVNATQSLLLQSGGAISSTAQTSAGGDIVIQTPSLALSGGSSISADALIAGRVSITAPAIILSGGSFIATDTVQASANGTDVSIYTASLSLDGSTISAQTTGTGAGGNVLIDSSGPLALTGTSLISASASSTASGTAGGVALHGTSLRLSGGSISSSNAGSHSGGDVTIDVKNAISIDQGGSVRATAAHAAGGNVMLLANSFSLSDPRSEISTMSTQGGSITVHARRGNLLLSDQALITAKTTQGNGGNITLDATGLLWIHSSTITARAAGTGGKISIDPRFVLLQNSTIDGRANGRDVTVAIRQAEIFIQSGDSQILSNSLSLPPQTDVAGQIIALPSALPQVRLSLAPVCAPRLDAMFSSFVVTGLDGRPPTPGGWVPDLIFADEPPQR